jgi:hypothetical protein
VRGGAALRRSRTDGRARTQALCAEKGVYLMKVPEKQQLGEWAGLVKVRPPRPRRAWPHACSARGGPSQLDADAKVRKVCAASSVAVRDFGEQSEGLAFLIDHIRAETGGAAQADLPAAEGAAPRPRPCRDAAARAMELAGTARRLGRRRADSQGALGQATQRRRVRWPMRTMGTRRGARRRTRRRRRKRVKQRRGRRGAARVRVAGCNLQNNAAGGGLRAGAEGGGGGGCGSADWARLRRRDHCS